MTHTPCLFCQTEADCRVADRCLDTEPPAPRLVTVRPGLTLHIWENGEEITRVRLTQAAALVLAARLLSLIAELRK